MCPVQNVKHLPERSFDIALVSRKITSRVMDNGYSLCFHPIQTGEAQPPEAQAQNAIRLGRLLRNVAQQRASVDITQWSCRKSSSPIIPTLVRARFLHRSLAFGCRSFAKRLLVTTEPSIPAVLLWNNPAPNEPLRGFSQVSLISQN